MMLPIHTILHPTDFSQYARQAFEFAAALARDYNAKLMIVHVHPTPVIGVLNGVMPFPTEVPHEDLMKELHAMTAPQVDVEYLLREGDPVNEIVRIANGVAADLIVMGTHGRGLLSRIFMGSVADGVLRKASCPVLTVRGRMADKKASTRTPMAEGARSHQTI